VLTADLVTARRRGGELRLVPLDGAARGRVAELAAAYLGLARSMIGRSRDELSEAWEAVAVASQEQRLAAGVRKLLLDRCLFSTPADVDPGELRRVLFTQAAAARRALPAGQPFDRVAVLQQVAEQRATDAATLEATLYADLHGAETLCDVGPVAPAQLAADFDLAQAQGVLLRATRLVADVRAADAAQMRALFHKLKFLRLLHTITPLPRDAGHRIEIDGPFSLFQAVTRYGLQLALALPSITAQPSWRIDAQVLWGQARQPLRFLWTGESPPAPGAAPPAAALSDEVAGLLRELRALDSPWRADPAADVLQLPGLGLCVPDLCFTHNQTGRRVYLEVLGFWSRDAVWRRIELVRGGLAEPILFAVSKQLRVSEAALDDDLPGALYVYARVMNARAVLSRVDALAMRG
jgi:predicted nuclease of restriction endonuclease-like RecB superfamily